MSERSERSGLGRIQWALFAATFVSFAWFHPGGGWNQNARFAMVRAIVEGGTVAIDDYLVYRPAPPGGGAVPRA